MFALEYTVEDGRRVLVGLSYEETAEFESLPAYLQRLVRRLFLLGQLCLLLLIRCWTTFEWTDAEHHSRTGRRISAINPNERKKGGASQAVAHAHHLQDAGRGRRLELDDDDVLGQICRDAKGSNQRREADGGVRGPLAGREPRRAACRRGVAHAGRNCRTAGSRADCRPSADRRSHRRGYRAVHRREAGACDARRYLRPRQTLLHHRAPRVLALQETLREVYRTSGVLQDTARHVGRWSTTQGARQERRMEGVAFEYPVIGKEAAN